MLEFRTKTMLLWNSPHSSLCHFSTRLNLCFRWTHSLTTVIYCWESCQGQVTLFTNPVVILVCRVCACVSVTLGAIQVPLLCSWAGLMRYQTQTSIHQPHWWGQWGATASVKRGIMAPHVGIGRPCLQRLLGTEGLKQYTTPASTFLCSAKLSSLTLGAASRDFLSLWFSGTKTQKKNVLLESGGLIFKCVHVCELVKRKGHRGLID